MPILMRTKLESTIARKLQSGAHHQQNCVIIALLALLVVGGCQAAPVPPPDDTELSADAKRHIARARAATVLVEGKKGNSGSGVLIGSFVEDDVKFGLIATNAHVLAGTRGPAFAELITDIHVRFFSGARPGEPIAVDLLYFDDSRDLALLAVRTARRPMPITDDPDSIEGRRIAIIGNPIEEEPLDENGKPKEVAQRLNLVTLGSGDEPVRFGGKFFYRFQVVAMPGNSGGPVVDLESGNVLGLVTQRYETDEKFGLAIPISDVESAVRKVDTNNWRAVARYTTAKYHLGIVVADLHFLAQNCEDCKDIGLGVRNRVGKFRLTERKPGGSMSDSTTIEMTPEQGLAYLNRQYREYRGRLRPALLSINIGELPQSLCGAVFAMSNACDGMMVTMNRTGYGAIPYKKDFKLFRDRFWKNSAEYERQLPYLAVQRPTAAKLNVLDENVRAASRLNMARDLLKHNKIDAASRYCREIIQRLPGSAAAVEAGVLLEQIDGK